MSIGSVAAGFYPLNNASRHYILYTFIFHLIPFGVSTLLPAARFRLDYFYRRQTRELLLILLNL